MEPSQSRSTFVVATVGQAGSFGALLPDYNSLTSEEDTFPADTELQ